jgi:ribosomal protein S14
MYYLKVKDYKRRILFKKFELQIRLKNFIYKNLLSYTHKNKPLLHSVVSYQILKKKRKRIITRITNRCILTNRSKSIRKLKISRIKARELVSYGIIPGFKKAVW